MPKTNLPPVSERYHPMTAEEFQQELNDLKMGQGRFALVAGMDESRVKRIAMGKEGFTVPYTIVVLLAYMQKDKGRAAYETLDEFLIKDDDAA